MSHHYEEDDLRDELNSRLRLHNKLEQDRARAEELKRKCFEMPAPPANSKVYNHYFKKLPHGITHIDVYQVLELFEITSPALQHAIKKLLVAGGREAKNAAQDVKESIDALNRWQEMQPK